MKPTVGSKVIAGHSLLPDAVYVLNEPSGGYTYEFSGGNNATPGVLPASGLSRVVDDAGTHLLLTGGTPYIRIPNWSGVQTNRVGGNNTETLTVAIVIDNYTNGANSTNKIIACKPGEWVIAAIIAAGGQPQMVYFWYDGATWYRVALGLLGPTNQRQIVGFSITAGGQKNSGGGGSMAAFAAGGFFAYATNATPVTPPTITGSSFDLTAGGTYTNDVYLGACPDGQGGFPAIQIETFQSFRRGLTQTQLLQLSADFYAWAQRFAPQQLWGAIDNRSKWPSNPCVAIQGQGSSNQSGGNAHMNVTYSRQTYLEALDVKTRDVGGYGFDTPCLTAYTLSRTIEFPVGVVRRVTWGGQNSVTIQPGQFVDSDVLKDAQGNSLVFPENSLLSFHDHYAVPIGASNYIPGDFKAGSANAYQDTTKTATPLAQADALDYNIADETGAGWPTTNIAYNYLPACAYLLGRKTGTPVPIWGGIGDSITWEANDGSPYPQGGYLTRAAVLAKVPHIKVGCPSETASNYAASHAQRFAVLNQCQYITVMIGTNDFAGNAISSAAYAALQASLTAIVTALRQVTPTAKVILLTIPPQVSTTDSCATLTNQTKRASETGTYTVQMYNQSIRSQFNSLYGADGFRDTATRLEANSSGPAIDGGLFSIVGGANGSDGTHPSNFGHIAMAVPVAEIMIASTPPSITSATLTIDTKTFGQIINGVMMQLGIHSLKTRIESGLVIEGGLANFSVKVDSNP